jgi:hypothetical protein
MFIILLRVVAAARCAGRGYRRRLIRRRAAFARLVRCCLASAGLAGCCTAPVPAPQGPTVATVWAIDNGWHTDLGLAVADLRPPLVVIAEDFPSASYLVFSFGDRSYLLSGHWVLPDMLGALFPGAALMWVTALRVPPAAAVGTARAVPLPLSSAGLARLSAFIWNDLAKNRNGRPASLGFGPSPDSLYYASSATYDAHYTCNTWTTEALQAAGLPVNTCGVLFSGQAMDQIRQIAHRLQPVPTDGSKSGKELQSIRLNGSSTTDLNAASHSAPSAPSTTR